MEEEKATMTVLTSQNYHIWIKEIQAYAEQYQVWEYVDPDGQVEPSTKEAPPKASDYQVAESGRSALNLKELTDQQRKEYKADVLEYQMLSKFTEEILQGIRNVSTAVKTSARQYILPHEMSSSVRQIIQTLTARYKLSNQKIVEQIHA
jgi:phage gp36-like protein